MHAYRLHILHLKILHFQIIFELDASLRVSLPDPDHAASEPRV
jgi:hypothetical protein